MKKFNSLQKEKAKLNITLKDLNESDDPLDNLLLDVMFESFYKRINNKRHIPKEQ